MHIDISTYDFVLASIEKRRLIGLSGREDDQYSGPVGPIDQTVGLDLRGDWTNCPDNGMLSSYPSLGLQS